MAALRLGLSRVPCIRLGHLSDAQRRAYILADNQLALRAGWDEELLKLELADLDALGFDLPLIGFSEDEMQDLLQDDSSPTAATGEQGEEGDEIDDQIPDLPARVVTRTGDIWCLGAHRLTCGDAREPAVVAALMQDGLAALCFTSPPYDGQREYANGAPEEWSQLMRAVSSQLPMREDGQVLINLGLVHRENEYVPYWQRWLNWMRVQGWRRFGWYVWDQGAGMPGDWCGRLSPSFEFIFHFNRKSRKPNKIVPCKYSGSIDHLNDEGIGGGLRKPDGSVGDWNHAGEPVQSHRIPDSVIRITRQKGGIGRGIDHPAVFPRELPEHMMLAFTDPDDLCYEPFSGSGTSLIAAEQTGRVMRACELAPAYVDVSIIRFRRAFPNVSVTLAETGETFEAVVARRLVDAEVEA
jgi:DNA modification methylase